MIEFTLWAAAPFQVRYTVTPIAFMYYRHLAQIVALLLWWLFHVSEMG